MDRCLPTTLRLLRRLPRPSAHTEVSRHGPISYQGRGPVVKAREDLRGDKKPKPRRATWDSRAPARSDSVVARSPRVHSSLRCRACLIVGRSPAPSRGLSARLSLGSPSPRHLLCYPLGPQRVKSWSQHRWWTVAGWSEHSHTTKFPATLATTSRGEVGAE